MGCGSSGLMGASAPYLKKYFETLEKEAGELGADPMALMVEMLEDPEAFQEKMLKRQEELNKKLEVLIHQSFDNHDKDKSGKLSAGESAVFFSNYAKCLSASNKGMMNMLMKTAMEAMGQALKQAGLPSEMLAAMRNEQQAEMKQMMKQINDIIDEMLKGYQENKAERDAKAFELLDTKKDGQLERDEVVAALMPNTEQNQAFMYALGFDPRKIERIAQKVQGGRF
ncbi:unnamed protein product [Amoebophrya sp. A120]|nr:unnamed protein product [Amoebophrya sp. A120]|eukprot:GSA120T00000586001.1